jgi:hypothetical protein
LPSEDADVTVEVLLAATLLGPPPPAAPDTLLPSTPYETVDALEGQRDDPELFERLAWLQEHPLDLNTVSREELLTLPGMTPAEADAVLRERRVRGEFGSPRALASIDPLGTSIFRKIGSYVTAVPRRLPGAGAEVRTRGVRDAGTETPAGAERHAGDPVKAYTRILGKAGWAEAGAVLEKDPGERYQDGYAAGYAAARGLGPLTMLLVGDYDLMVGQGLVFWRGAAPGRGSDAASAPLRSATGIRPHRSTEEESFLRGAAATVAAGVGTGEVAATAFVSRRGLSGTSDAESGAVAPAADGLFRTPEESARRNAFRESLFGVHLAWESGDGVRIGASGYAAGFDRPVYAAGRGLAPATTLRVGGAEGSWTSGPVTLFGEAAASSYGGGAWIGGALIALPGGGGVSIAARSCAPDFVNPHASAFTQRSEARNEQGVYAGVQLPLSREVRLSGFLDHFNYPSPTATVSFPSKGYEALAQVEVRPERGVELAVRGSYRMSEENGVATDPAERSVETARERRQGRVRGMITVRPRPSLRFRTRVEVTAVEPAGREENDRGVLFAQEAGWMPVPEVSLDARLSIFDTDSYDSRLYAVEQDVAGSYSNPPLYGKGARWYLVARLRPFPAAGIAAKYGETVVRLGDATVVEGRISLQLDLEL